MEETKHKRKIHGKVFNFLHVLHCFLKEYLNGCIRHFFNSDLDL